LDLGGSPVTLKRVVLAAPHARYDALEEALRSRHELDVLRIRDAEQLTSDRIAAFAPRYVFFPHWSWKIPAAIYQTYECVIFHMTDVPFGRGGSPLQNLIALGHSETKLSALRCVAELDAGPVYAKRPLSLLGTAEEIFARAAELMEEVIAHIVADEPVPQPQAGEPVLFKRRTPEQGDLLSAASLGELHDMIRMLDAEGYPHAFLEVGGLRLEFTRASRSHDHVRADVRISLKDGEKPK
jgi:methionyl-tRNA formyltransferase